MWRISQEQEQEVRVGQITVRNRCKPMGYHFGEDKLCDWHDMAKGGTSQQLVMAYWLSLLRDLFNKENRH